MLNTKKWLSKLQFFDDEYLVEAPTKIVIVTKIVEGGALSDRGS